MAFFETPAGWATLFLGTPWLAAGTMLVWYTIVCVTAKLHVVSDARNEWNALSTKPTSTGFLKPFGIRQTQDIVSLAIRRHPNEGKAVLAFLCYSGLGPYSILVAGVWTGQIDLLFLGNGVPANLLVTVLATVPTWLLLTLFWAAYRHLVTRYTEIELDGVERICRFVGPSTDEVPFDEVVAVQLNFGPLRGQSEGAVEVNLVWQPLEAPVDEGPRRRTIHLDSPTRTLTRMATGLVERLRVPLVNHATREHWLRRIAEKSSGGVPRHRNGGEF